MKCHKMPVLIILFSKQFLLNSKVNNIGWPFWKEVFGEMSTLLRLGDVIVIHFCDVRIWLQFVLFRLKNQLFICLCILVNCTQMSLWSLFRALNLSRRNIANTKRKRDEQMFVIAFRLTSGACAWFMNE